MEISARNQLQAKVKKINSDNVSSEITLDVGGQEMCSTITTTSAQNLGLKEGDTVNAVVKASNVMIEK